MVGPCTRLVACLIITGIIVCVDAVIGSSVHMKARLSICTTPTFTIELNSKVNIAFFGCGYCTPTNKPGEYIIKDIKNKNGNNNRELNEGIHTSYLS